MSISVRWDQVEGERLSVNRDGWSTINTAIVSGLTGTGSARMKQAMDALGVSLNPPSLHPTVPNCYLENIEADTAGSGSVARVTLTYRRGPDEEAAETFYEWDTVASQESVNKDNLGQTMLVRYYTLDANGNIQQDSDGDDIYSEISGTVPMLLPHTVMVVRRREAFDPAAPPGALALTYVGKVNDGPWGLHPAAEPRTWLCTGINGTSDDHGWMYEMRYSFEYKPVDRVDAEGLRYGGWDAVIVYRDADGRIPGDVDSGANYGHGRKVLPIYQEINFDGLGLTP